ncbi:MAG: hypothetical protein MZW92_53190 [Comamonadaceae bacterium]|nr:hypothetical protein [Comamonadaceae bacterium]
MKTGRDEHRHWAPFPAVRCYPIVLTVRCAPGPARSATRPLRLSREAVSV